MDIRRFGAQYRSRAYTLARTHENYATYYDIHYPNEERLAGRPLRLSPAYPRLGGARRASFGEKSGWERPNWFEPNADGRRRGRTRPLEALRPRGWAGEHWSPADRRRGAGHAHDGRPVRRDELRQDRGRPARAPRASSQRLCANDVDRPVGSVTYTQLLNRRGGIECDLTVTRRRRTGSCSSPDRVRQPRPGLDPEARPGRRHASLSATSPSARVVLRAVGPAGARHPRRDHARRRLGRRLPVPHGPRDHGGPRAAAGAPGHVRRRAGLGAVRAHRVRRGALGHAVGGRPAARPGGRRLPGDRRAAPGEGLPGLGGRHHPRGDARTRPASASRSALDKGRLPRPGRAGGGEGRPGPRKRLRCLVLDDPRSVVPRQRAGPDRRAHRRTGDVRRATGSPSSGASPTRTCRRTSAIGARGEVDVFGTWTGFEVAREPLYDPAGERIRA